MVEKTSIEQIKNDFEYLKKINKHLENNMKRLNYTISNLSLDYPEMFKYVNNKVHLNEEFDFSKSYIKKAGALEIINLLDELSKDYVDNKMYIDELQKYLDL